MSANGLQKNCFFALLSDELKYDPQIVPGGTGPLASQAAFQPVRAEPRIESIFR